MKSTNICDWNLTFKVLWWKICSRSVSISLWFAFFRNVARKLKEFLESVKKKLTERLLSHLLKFSFRLFLHHRSFFLSYIDSDWLIFRIYTSRSSTKIKIKRKGSCESIRKSIQMLTLFLHLRFKTFAELSANFGQVRSYISKIAPRVF